MRLLYCDETNLQQRRGDFLIYGGVTVPAKHVHHLSQRIDELREEAGIDPSYPLKFNPSPPDLDHAEFIALKQHIIQVAVEHSAQVILYLVLHDIAGNPDRARLFGINELCYRFNRLLRSRRQYGFVFIDYFDDRGQLGRHHLREKFSRGLQFQEEGPYERLERIVGFHYSSIGQAHMPSVVDITVGSFRYAVNVIARGQDEHLETARTLLRVIAPMCIRRPQDGRVSRFGLALRPTTVGIPHFRARYQRLWDFLAENDMRPEQEIRAPD